MPDGGSTLAFYFLMGTLVLGLLYIVILLVVI